MGRIKFIESTHKYVHEKGELVSVSKFLERFKEKVNWKKIAANTAKKLSKEGTPTTTEEIQKKWESKRVQASKVGTKYHHLREKQLLAEEEPEFYGQKCKVQNNLTLPGGNKYSLPVEELQNNSVYPELMIYDLEHMICGQADKVIITNNKINVWDYKTDKEITFKAFSNQWVSPRRLLKPLDKLEDANGNHYAIKMSLYMYLIWKANKGKFKPGELIIEHIQLKRDPDNMDLPVIDEKGLPVVLKIEQIKLPYLKKEVMAMLKTLK